MLIGPSTSPYKVAGVLVQPAGGRLVIQSEAGPERTVIDCDRQGPFLNVAAKGPASVEIRGLTVQNGAARANDPAGAIGSNCGLTVENCIFQKNSGPTAGAVSVVASAGSGVALAVVNCVFYKNSSTADQGGGAIALTDATLSIQSSTLYLNTSKGSISNALRVFGSASITQIVDSILWDPEQGGGGTEWLSARPSTAARLS